MTFDGDFADGLIQKSRLELDREESAIEALAAAGAFDHVALYAQASAHRAAYRHAGVFSSAATERALLAAGASLEPGNFRPTGSVERVLHVATETPGPEGGHSRMIERWIRSDASRSHSLVLTSPRNGLPPDLAEAVWNSQGAAYQLAVGSCSFMRRAAELRELASGFDAVILHTHPYDVVPSIALATPARPPCILFNLAGHLFWIGTRVADVVASGRPVAAELAIKRRGVEPNASHLLPVIAASHVENESTPEAARDSTRHSLGIKPTDFVFVTVASAYKLDPIDSFDLSEILQQVIAQRPWVRWLVVGAPPDGKFAASVAATPNITCVAPTNDLRSVLAVADAYLDSYPFTSQTSLVDAAASGLPVLALRGHANEAFILGAWGGSLDEALLEFASAADLLRLIDELAIDSQRMQSGRKARDAVELQSVGAGWASRLDLLLEHVRQRLAHRLPDGSVPTTRPIDAPTVLDRYLALVNQGSEPSRTFVDWQRDITNFGATEWFPGAEEWLSRERGLAGVVGQLELSLRDQEDRFRRFTQQPS